MAAKTSYPFVDLTTFTALEVVALAEVWRDVKRRGEAVDRDIFGRSPAGDANILPEERTLSPRKIKNAKKDIQEAASINDLEKKKTSFYVGGTRNKEGGGKTKKAYTQAQK